MSAPVADRELLRARAVQLHAEGLSDRLIAERLGFSHATAVWKLRHPRCATEMNRRDNARRRQAKRAWENEHDRGRCACGAVLYAGSRSHGTKVCQGCHLDTVKLGRAMRCERIYEMWHAGAPLREIAVALDSTANSIGRTLVGMRKEGWDVPPRPPGGLRRASR